MATINQQAAQVEIEALKGYGLQVQVTGRNIVEVEGWRGNAEVEATLTARGYKLDRWGIAALRLPDADTETPRERYESASPEEQYEMDTAWVRMGGHLGDHERQAAIKSGKSYTEYARGK